MSEFRLVQDCSESCWESQKANRIPLHSTRHLSNLIQIADVHRDGDIRRVIHAKNISELQTSQNVGGCDSIQVRTRSGVRKQCQL